MHIKKHSDLPQTLLRGGALLRHRDSSGEQPHVGNTKLELRNTLTAVQNLVRDALPPAS